MRASAMARVVVYGFQPYYQAPTLDDSLDPIPTPQGARLVDGTAKLPRIRKGRVQFVVEFDGGGRVFFTRDVDAAQPLAVRLPFPVR